MVLEAIEEFNIDTKVSWFVGDTTSDILAGKRAGLRNVLVKTGEAGLDGKHNVEPDFVSKHLEAAIELILETSEGKLS